jgi:hypothetical protein
MDLHPILAERKGNAKKEVFPAQGWSRKTGPVSGSAEKRFHESLPHPACSILRPFFPLGGTAIPGIHRGKKIVNGFLRGDFQFSGFHFNGIPAGLADPHDQRTDGWQIPDEPSHLLKKD